MKIGEEEEQEESRRRRETHWRRQSQSAAGVASAVSNCAACQCGPNACSLAAADLSKSDGLCASVARRDENGERIRVDWVFFLLDRESLLLHQSHITPCGGCSRTTAPKPVHVPEQIFDVVTYPQTTHTKLAQFCLSFCFSLVFLFEGQRMLVILS